MPFIIIAILAAIITRAITDGRTDYALAKQGIVSPRLQAKHGGKRPAAEATSGYGLTGHIRACWLDYWPRRTEAVKAARDARDQAKRGSKASPAAGWVQQTKAAIAAGRQAIGALRWPNERPRPAPKPGPANTTLIVDNPDRGTVRITPNGREQWDGRQWTPLDDPRSKNPTAPTAAGPKPARQPTPNRRPEKPKEPDMTTPSGEAVNYESAVAELTALESAVTGQLDHLTGVRDALNTVAEHIDAAQADYRNAAAAAQSINDHLSALNLDGVTLGNVGTITDSLPVDAVDAAHERLDGLQVHIEQLISNAEAALGAIQAALQHLQGTYGDANDTVQSQLGGDAAFLDGHGRQIHTGQAVNTDGTVNAPGVTSNDLNRAQA